MQQVFRGPYWNTTGEGGANWRRDAAGYAKRLEHDQVCISCGRAYGLMVI